MTSLNTKETAKAVRVILKSEFPGVKFSVRGDNYSMGSSIIIKWTDGPTSKTVESKIEHLGGKHYNSLGITRNYSPELLERIKDTVSKIFGGEVPVIKIWGTEKNASFFIQDNDQARLYWKIQSSSLLGPDGTLICEDYLYGDIISGKVKW